MSGCVSGLCPEAFRLVQADLRPGEVAEPVSAEEEEQEEAPGLETVQRGEYGREHPFHQNRSSALPPFRQH